jgi:methylenetetrahydrofolate--tRNA-(uracil-5-)-methyltransferase
MHVNFGLMPALDPPVRGKRERAAAYAARGAHAMASWVDTAAALGIEDVTSRVAALTVDAGAQ